MLLEVRHVTQYHYDHAVRESVMELWMQPQKSPRQRQVRFELDLEPAAQLFSYVDVWGNAVYHFGVPQPHDRLTIDARSVVETSPILPQGEALDMGEWDRLKSEFVRGDCFDFLQPFRYAVETPRLRAFTAEHGIDDLHRFDPWTAVRALSDKLYEAFEYEPGVTEADSPIDHALEARRGVCQDFAHIMITICRAWGIPARYISGYLFTERNENRSDPDATHAWVEVFLPSLRWVGLDPTNDILAGERHIAVAVGRDYADVPPSRGVYKGDADSELEVAVSVRRAKSGVVEPELLRPSRPAFSAATRRRMDTAFRDQQAQQQQ